MGTRLTRSQAGSQSSLAPDWRDLALAGGRIALGAYWLWEQHWKLPPEFGVHDPRGLMFSFQSSIDHPTLGLYRAFLQDLVVPNFYLFGWLVFVSETLIGLSLTLGLLTRAGAVLGTLQSINLLVAQGATEEGPWLYLGLIAANMAVLFTPANRRLSLDRLVAAKPQVSIRRAGRLGRVVRWMIGE
jgi:thiosulfate dehydrogenase (quinone) large subunit